MVIEFLPFRIYILGKRHTSFFPSCKNFYPFPTRYPERGSIKQAQ
nr:MAG TPA: hypothetical protein [Caudoviricetes sp.]